MKRKMKLETNLLSKISKKKNITEIIDFDSDSKNDQKTQNSKNKSSNIRFFWY